MIEKENQNYIFVVVYHYKKIMLYQILIKMINIIKNIKYKINIKNIKWIIKKFKFKIIKLNKKN